MNLIKSNNENLLNNSYPFGMGMPTRSWSVSGENYLYGFQGQESDDEIYGNNNELDFGSRIYDPRLGRWMSVDPMHKKYAHLSPYIGMGDNPVSLVDVGGDSTAYYSDAGVLLYVSHDHLVNSICVVSNARVVYFKAIQEMAKSKGISLNNDRLNTSLRNGGINYDIDGFKEFYNNYAHKTEVPSPEDLRFKGPNDATSQPAKYYAEYAAPEIYSERTNTVGLGNTDPVVSNDQGRVKLEDINSMKPKVSQTYWVGLTHIHTLDEGAYSWSNGFFRDVYGSGPSLGENGDGDYNGAQGVGDFRNIVIEKDKLYLYKDKGNTRTTDDNTIVVPKDIFKTGNE